MKFGIVSALLVVAALLATPGIGSAHSTSVPARTPANLIVAAYNIQWIGQKRHDFKKLADVIEHFDVCGIVEVKDEDAIAELVEILIRRTGFDWGFTYGVRTHRPSGNYHEAFAAVWRRDRVQLNGLVGGIWDRIEAFRNDPYVVSFKRGNFDFALLLIHTRWTDDADGSRKGEVEELARQITWMRSITDEKDFVVAGDFNYSGGTTVMKNFATQAGLVQVDPNKKSTFRRNNTAYANSYDHIYLSQQHTTEYMPGTADTLDATTMIYGSRNPPNMAKSKAELSDHLPVFAIFGVDGVDDD